MADRLDDATGMRALDPTDMLSQLVSFPDQLLWSKDSRIPPMEGVHNVVICAVGGSAIAGDVITDLLTPTCNVPIATSRHVTMPGYANEGTLALVISYSGNTAESLNQYHDAAERGCCVVVITSGGELEKLADKDLVPILKVPTGNQPRASLGYLLGTSAAVLQGAGLGHTHEELIRAVPSLREYIQKIKADVPTSTNSAKKIALALRHRVTAIYSPRNVRSVALRWQNQINENAKAVSFSGEIPEMDHNQLVGWLEGGRDCSCRPVVLMPGDMHPIMRKMTEVTLQMLNERGLDPVKVELPGKGLMDNVLQGIALGDMVSYYMAMLKGIDPTPVAVIKEFKKRIS